MIDSVYCDVRDIDYNDSVAFKIEGFNRARRKNRRGSKMARQEIRRLVVDIQYYVHYSETTNCSALYSHRLRLQRRFAFLSVCVLFSLCQRLVGFFRSHGNQFPIQKGVCRVIED
jgi:hypothetical protein